MIVNCDKCGAKFQLADEKITDKGTKVRCSKCKAIFTVKKPEEKAGPPPAAPPPPPKPSAPKAAGEKKPDDPFSDFNFSDDLDFGDKEIDVKPKQEDPDKGFLDSVPSAPIPTAAKPAPAAPADDGGFDFSDEDFSLSDPEPAAAKPVAPTPPPRPAAAPKPPPAPPKPSAPAKPAGKSPETDEFGDFKFDDESFSDSPAAAKPAPAGGGASEEWGNVAIGSDDPAPKAKPGGEDIDEAGFGDFKFDDGSGGGDKDDEIDVDSFRRSEKSNAPVRDDLEASIGDNESEPETSRPAPRKPEPVEAPPPPPKPVIKPEPRKSSGGRGWVKFVVIGAVFLGVIFGGVGYTNSQGWFSFGDLFSLKFKKLGDIPAVNQWMIENGYREIPDTGAIEIVEGSVKPQQIAREDLGVTIIVITGQVANRTNKIQTGIKVQAGLKNANGDIVATASSYCGVDFTDTELKTMGKEEIQSIADMSTGRDMKCMEVPPGTALPFSIIFFDYPSDGGALKVSAPQVVESKVLGE